MKWTVLVLALCLSQVASAEVTPEGRLRITQLVKDAAARDKAGDPVAAWRHLAEAERLERLWSGNTLGDDGPAGRAWTQYMDELIKREDGAISKVLHSQVVPLGDKLNLLRRLEDDVVMSHRDQSRP